MLIFDVRLGKWLDQSRNDWFRKICFGMKFHENSDNLTFSMKNDQFHRKMTSFRQKMTIFKSKTTIFKWKMTIFDKNDQFLGQNWPFLGRKRSNLIFVCSYLKLNNRPCFDQLRFRSVRPWNTVQEKWIFAQSLDRFEKIWCQVHFISQFRLFRLEKFSIFSQ